MIFLLDKPMETRKAMQDLTYIISTPCRPGEDGACENREKDSPTTTQAGYRPASTSSNSGPRQVYRAVAHVQSSIDVWALVMRIPGCVRRVLKLEVPAHSSAQASPVAKFAR